MVLLQFPEEFLLQDIKMIWKKKLKKTKLVCSTSVFQIDRIIKDSFVIKINIKLWDFKKNKNIFK